MIPPSLTDGEGHDIQTLTVSDAEWLWQLDCLLEVSTAHAEGRKVSFEIPSSNHEPGVST